MTGAEVEEFLDQADAVVTVHDYGGGERRVLLAWAQSMQLYNEWHNDRYESWVRPTLSDRCTAVAEALLLPPAKPVDEIAAVLVLNDGEADPLDEFVGLLIRDGVRLVHVSIARRLDDKALREREVLVVVAENGEQWLLEPSASGEEVLVVRMSGDGAARAVGRMASAFIGGVAIQA